MSKKNKYLSINSKPKYFVFLCLYYLLYPICKILYGRKRNWLICERGNDAQDNGFIFFKYLVDNHPEIKPTYIIRRSSPEYEKVAKIGRTVEFCSLKHFLMTIGCPVKISSHLFGYSPWIQMTTYFRRHKTHHKHVFLQHGVIKNDHPGFYKDVCKSLDLFVCGAEPEYQFINNTFHYNNDVPQYTGLARYDLLANYKVNNQILVMPTWRAKLVDAADEEFIQSEFYKHWNSLINNSDLLQECKSSGITIKFYLHYSLQKFSDLFKGNDVVKIVKFGEETVQQLLKESKLLITDFSSIYFDYGYMKKPVIHYQFDEDTFHDEHYEKGYFDYRRDGFGDVCLTEDETIKSINKVFENNFIVEEKYLNRIQRFFVFNDTNNCKRTFDQIKKINE